MDFFQVKVTLVIFLQSEGSMWLVKNGSSL